jgi:hypothetical protein
VLIDRENKMALVTGIAVPLTYNLLKTEAEKIKNFEQLALEIKNIWKLSNISVHSLVVSAKRVVTRSFPKCIENIGLTKSVMRVEQKSILLQTRHIVR